MAGSSRAASRRKRCFVLLLLTTSACAVRWVSAEVVGDVERAADGDLGADAGLALAGLGVEPALRVEHQKCGAIAIGHRDAILLVHVPAGVAEALAVVVPLRRVPARGGAEDIR